MLDARVPRRAGLRWAARAVVLGLTVTALLAGAGPASAHAVLESTDPVRDVVGSALPAHVTLTFGESVALPPGGLRVFDPDGVQVDDGQSGHPGGLGNAVQVGLRPGVDEQGSYTVAWRVVSADTHPVSGAFTFSVGHPSATPAATAAPPGDNAAVDVLYGAVRAVAYGSFAALVGAAALILLCSPTGAARRTAATVAVVGWAALLVSTVGTLLLQGPYGNGTGLGSALDPGAVAATLALPLGSAVVARVLLLVAWALALRRLVHGPPPAGARAVACGGALAAATAATWSFASHAAVGPQPLVALPVDVAHLVSMGVWLGGLPVLAIALRAARRPEERRDLAVVVARFSPIAATCVAVLVATGAYQSWRQLGSLSAFGDTGYGRLLLIKLVAVAALLAVAGVSRREVRAAAGRRVPRRQPVAVGGPGPPGRAEVDPATIHPGSPTLALLGRTVLVETAVAVAVLAVTAVLVDAEPGRTAEAAAVVAAQGPVRATLPYDTGGPGGAGALDLRIDPARTGPNTVDITVHDPTGAAIDPPELRGALTLPDRHLGPLAVPIERAGPGHYLGVTQVPLPGDWQLAVTVRTSEIDETTVRLPVPVH